MPASVVRIGSTPCSSFKILTKPLTLHGRSSSALGKIRTRLAQNRVRSAQLTILLLELLDPYSASALVVPARTAIEPACRTQLRSASMHTQLLRDPRDRPPRGVRPLALSSAIRVACLINSREYFRGAPMTHPCVSAEPPSFPGDAIALARAYAARKLGPERSTAAYDALGRPGPLR